MLMRRTKSVGVAAAIFVAAGVGLQACHPVNTPEPSSRGLESHLGSEPFELAVVGSAVKVRPHERVTGPRGATLVAARNEFESFQIAIHAKATPLQEVHARLGAPLVGPGGAKIPETNVSLFREGYIDIHTPSDFEGAPGPWPDALIPAVDTLVGEARNAFPLSVPAGENRMVWVDVLVPMDAPPGKYEGRVDVELDGARVEVPVSLEVLNFTLPSTTSLKSVFGLSQEHGCRELGFERCGWDLDVRARARALFVRAALDNRMTIADPHPASIESAAGLTAFREYSLPFIHGTAPTRLPGARLTTFQVTRLHSGPLASWRDEILAQGLMDRAFAYVCDEPHFFPVYGDMENNWRLCRAEAEKAQAAWPEIPKLITAHIQSTEEYGTGDLLDIMVLNVELLDGPPYSPWFPGNQRPLYDEFLDDPHRRKELWLYTACGSHGCIRNEDPYTVGWAGYEIDAPASQTRAMAWLAYRYQMTGTLYFDTVLQLHKAWEDQYEYTGNGEGTLFYPGTPDRIGGKTPIPVESIRIKLVRDGYEDYEYLKFLSENGMEAEAQQIARELFPAPYQTTRSDAEVQAARWELAKRVASLTAPATSDSAGHPDGEGAESNPSTPSGNLARPGEGVGPHLDGSSGAGEPEPPLTSCQAASGGGLLAMFGPWVIAALVRRTRTHVADERRRSV